MLDHRTILDHDIFSFTRPGQPWLVKEWLFQCIAAGLDKIGGLPLVSAATALFYGCLPVMLYKTMVRQNANIYIALTLLSVTFLGLIAHCHVRPHIFTYFFFIILMEKILSYEHNRKTAFALFSFIPVMILWCNLHGGFLIAPAIAGLAFLTAAYRFFCSSSAQDFNKMKTYFLFGTGMALATFINPKGWHLHTQLLTYLSSDLLHKWQEFASPDFNYGGVTTTLFLFLVLAFFGLVYRKKTTISLLEFTFLLFFMYQAFHAIRHIFLFILLAIPIIARELTAMTTGWDNWFTKKSQVLLADQKQIKGDRIYIPLLCAVFIGLSLVRPDLYKTDFYGSRLTQGTGMFIKENKEQFKRPFNAMDIGGTLAYHFWPDIRLFADDRLDYYGEDFFSDEYLTIALMKPGWSPMLDKYDIDSAIINSEPLAMLLKESSRWHLAYEEEKNYIFLRSDNASRNANRQNP
jgi:hypothetical protein